VRAARTVHAFASRMASRRSLGRRRTHSLPFLPSSADHGLPRDCSLRIRPVSIAATRSASIASSRNYGSVSRSPRAAIVSSAWHSPHSPCATMNRAGTDSGRTEAIATGRKRMGVRFPDSATDLRVCGVPEFLGLPSVLSAGALAKAEALCKGRAKGDGSSRPPQAGGQTNRAAPEGTARTERVTDWGVRQGIWKISPAYPRCRPCRDPPQAPRSGTASCPKRPARRWVPKG